MPPSPMLVKKPSGGVSFKVLDVAAERKLLHTVLKERHVSVRERVSRMERNIRAVDLLRRVSGATEDHVGLYFNQSVAISDLMTAAIWGARLRDPFPPPSDLPLAEIDPSWIDIVRENARQEAIAAGKPGSIAEAQEEIRARLEEERGQCSTTWHRREPSSASESFVSEAPVKEDDAVSERVHSDVHISPQKVVKKQAHKPIPTNKAVDACEDISDSTSKPHRQRRKPMLQTVATKLRKSIARKPKPAESNADNLDATLITTTETRTSADGARTIRVRKVKKRVKKVKPMKTGGVSQPKERRRSVLGMSKHFVVSVTDVFGSQSNKNKDDSFEMSVSDIKTSRRRSKRLSLTRSSNTSKASKDTDQTFTSMSPMMSSNLSPASTSTSRSGSPAHPPTSPEIGFKASPMSRTTLPDSAGVDTMEPAMPGVRVGTLASQRGRANNRSALDFKRFAMYFGGSDQQSSGGGAATSRHSRNSSGGGATTVNEPTKCRPKSYDARNLQSRQGAEFELQDKSRSSFCMRVKHKTSDGAKSLFGSFKASFKGSSTKRMSLAAASEESLMHVGHLVGHGDSFKSTGGLSEYSEYTILEEEEEEDDFNLLEDEEDCENDDADDEREDAIYAAYRHARNETIQNKEDYYVELTF